MSDTKSVWVTKVDWTEEVWKPYHFTLSEPRICSEHGSHNDEQQPWNSG